MTTPRNRFTVIPTLLAFFVGLVHQPATNVVKVDANGMGIEYEQPWLTTSNGLQRAVSMVRGVIERLSRRFAIAQRHALFKPIAVGAAAVLVACFVHIGALLAMPLAIGATLTEGRHAGEFLVWEANAFARESATVLSGQTLKAGAVVGRVSLGIGRVSIPTVVGTGNGTVNTVFCGPEVEVGNYVLTCTSAVTHGGVWSLTTPSGYVLPAVTMTPGAGGSTVYTSRHINFTIVDGSTDFAADDVFTFVVGTTAPTVIGGTGTGVMTALSLGPDAKPGRYVVINRAVVAEGGDFEVISPDGDSIGRFLMGTTSTGTAAFTSRQVNFTLSDATDYILNNRFDICVFNQLAGGKVVAWDPTTFDGRHRVKGVLLAAVDAASADLGGVVVSKNAVVMKGALEWSAAITSSQKESAYAELAARNITALDSVA